MRIKQIQPQPIRRKYRHYTYADMMGAYKAVKEKGVTVLRAAKLFGVPENTLRDRVNGKVDPECVTMGMIPLFDKFEETKLVNHLKLMATFGYGYTQQEYADVALDFAVGLEKRTPEAPLSKKWMSCFLSRWPEVRTLLPKNIDQVYTKIRTEDRVNGYFKNLEECLKKYDLIDKPHLIFNLQEMCISVEHQSPSVVDFSESCLQTVKWGKGKTVTVLVSGSARGMAIPPYFLFPGKKLAPGLLDGASLGTSGNVTESGWSNSFVLRNYLESHFLKFAPDRSNEKILLLLDGNVSHVGLGLVEWATANNIVLFVLPAKLSHFLQPLDVECYEPFQKMYINQCRRLKRQSSTGLTKFKICEIACQAYTKALASANLQAAFRKTGVYPLNRNAINNEELRQEDSPAALASEGPMESVGDRTALSAEDTTKSFSGTDLFEKLRQLVALKNEAKKPRKIRGQIIVEKEVDDADLSHSPSQSSVKRKKSETKSRGRTSSTPRASSQHSRAKKRKRSVKKSDLQTVPSDTSLTTDGDSDSSNAQIAYDDDEEETCCVCGLWTPEEVSDSKSLIFTKWAQCDGIRDGKSCGHWTHLAYCSNVRAIRKTDKFYCPHCIQTEEEALESDEEKVDTDEETDDSEEEVADSDEEVVEQEEEIAEPDEEIAEPDEEITEPDEEIAEPDEEITEPDEEITEPDEEIAEPDEEVTEIVEEVNETVEEMVEVEIAHIVEEAIDTVEETVSTDD